MDALILIDIVKSLPGTLIAAAVAYYFSQRRYTFEKLHDRRLSCMEEIFGRITSLEKDLRKYVMTTGSMVGKDYLDDRRKELGPIQDKFFDLQEYFWKKEIALNQSSIDAVQGFITSSIEILSNLQASNYSANMEDGSTSYRQWGAAYEIMQNKLTLAKKELVLDFRRVMQS